MYILSPEKKLSVIASLGGLIREFMGVRTVAELLAFLNSTGHFCDPHDRLHWHADDQRDAGELKYGVTDFWQVQGLLAEMLLSRKPAVQIPEGSLPERWAEAFGEGFSFRVVRRLGSYVAEVRTQDTLTTLIAAAQLKVLQGVKCRICKRPDCARPFEVETRGRRKKQYCDYACAHTAWQRRVRGTKVQLNDERLQFGYGKYRSRKRKES